MLRLNPNEADAIVVTRELLRELKKRAAESNSLYHLARRTRKQQRHEAHIKAQKEKT